MEEGALPTLSFFFLVFSSTTFSPPRAGTLLPHLPATILVKGAMPSFALAVLDWLADGTKNKSARGFSRLSGHELLQKKTHAKLDVKVKSVSDI